MQGNNKHFVFDEPADLIAKFDELKGGDDLFIVYMTGGVDAASGKSWCPDCDVARPNISAHVIEKTELVVIKGNVNDRNTWVGTGTHPFKTHPVLKAGGVPSLLLVGNGGQVLMRAESENDFNNKDLLEVICTGED